MIIWQTDRALMKTAISDEYYRDSTFRKLENDRKNFRLLSNPTDELWRDSVTLWSNYCTIRLGELVSHNLGSALYNVDAYLNFQTFDRKYICYCREHRKEKISLRQKEFKVFFTAGVKNNFGWWKKFRALFKKNSMSMANVCGTRYLRFWRCRPPAISHFYFGKLVTVIPWKLPWFFLSVNRICCVSFKL